MLPALRQAFQSRYQPDDYRQLLRSLDACARTHVSFRVAETPCFFPRELLDRMAGIGAELTHALVSDSSYRKASSAAIPEAYRAADENAHPHFMTADFGLVRSEAGELEPRLVELQAFPSVYGFQFLLAELYRSTYHLDPDLGYLLGGHTESSFWKSLEQVIVGRQAPEEVALTEVEPDNQKTLPDFLLTADRLGIEIVDIAQVVAEPVPGKPTRLYYRKNGRRSPIRRIYNRAIVDELIRNKVQLPFDYREPLDVEWAGHPNWYFHLSKFSLPYLRHWAVPPAVFLSDWMEGRGRDRLPEDRQQWILKPLFSFAGKGIEFAPSDELLASIPRAQRREYLLQERVQFEPVIATPSGMTQAEVRILYLWPDGEALRPSVSLVRLGRGKMMGVDHNRDQDWVGASAAFYPR